VTDEEQMRKALLISYRFPPQSGGGVQRTLKFTKYLREFGWEPVVQTARNPYWPLRDDSLLEDVPPGVRVYRTPSFEIERLEQRLASLAGQGKDEKRNRPAGEGGGAAGAGRTRGQSRGGVLNAIRGVVHRRLLVPDAQIAWLPGALAHSMKIDLVAEGASNKLIARRLGISAHTAKYHVASLLDKLDAVSRTDAVAHAARIGVLHL